MLWHARISRPAKVPFFDPFRFWRRPRSRERVESLLSIVGVHNSISQRLVRQVVQHMERAEADPTPALKLPAHCVFAEARLRGATKESPWWSQYKLLDTMVHNMLRFIRIGLSPDLTQRNASSAAPPGLSRAQSTGTDTNGSRAGDGGDDIPGDQKEQCSARDIQRMIPFLDQFYMLSKAFITEVYLPNIAEPGNFEVSSPSVDGNDTPLLDIKVNSTWPRVAYPTAGGNITSGYAIAKSLESLGYNIEKLKDRDNPTLRPPCKRNQQQEGKARAHKSTSVASTPRHYNSSSASHPSTPTATLVGRPESQKKRRGRPPKNLQLQTLGPGLVVSSAVNGSQVLAAEVTMGGDSSSYINKNVSSNIGNNSDSAILRESITADIEEGLREFQHLHGLKYALKEKCTDVTHIQPIAAASAKRPMILSDTMDRTVQHERNLSGSSTETFRSECGQVSSEWWDPIANDDLGLSQSSAKRKEATPDTTTPLQSCEVSGEPEKRIEIEDDEPYFE